MLNLEIAKKKKNELTNQLSLDELTIYDLRKALETSQKEQVQEEEDYHTEQKNAQSWEEKRHEVVKRISSLNAQYSRSNAQYEVMQQAEEQLSGYSQGAKVLLKALKEAKIKGVGDLFGRIIEVPEYLEKAIQALLGEFIDIVIMRTE